MSIVVNFRSNQSRQSRERNIKNIFIHMDTYEHKIFTYKNKQYLFYDLKNYKNITLECDANDEDMDVKCIKNKNNNNICIWCNNFQEISIIYHYYGYEYGPCASNMNAPLWSEIIIDDTDFNDAEENVSFLT